MKCKKLLIGRLLVLVENIKLMRFG